MLLICLYVLGRCYCLVADGIATFFVYNVIADVIAQWQMEWPLQGVSGSLLVDVVPREAGRCGYLF